MDKVTIQCGYCRLEHFTTKRIDNICCLRCHSLIPIQTCNEVTNYTNILKNRSQRDAQLQKNRGSSLHHGTYRKESIGSTSRSSEYKALTSQRPKASFTILNACPRGISATRLGKRALICGVSYKRQKYKLKGTLTDVYNITQLLMNRYHYPERAIRILTGNSQLCFHNTEYCL